MKNSQESSDGSVVFTLKHYSFYALGWILLAAAAQAQPVLHLRGWDSIPKAVQGFRRTRKPGRSHFLVQFAAQPGAPQLSALAGRGANALSYVPDFTLSISMPNGTDLSGLGIRWMGQLQPAEKISPLLTAKLTSGPAPPVIVEFYSDVLEGDARAIAAETGASILDNPDLLPHHLLIEGTGDQVRQLADWDEVSYIFPASQDLVQGVPAYGCAGALTSAGPVAQAVPLVGAWPGNGSASLNYAFVSVTGQDPQSEVESEIERAYAEWAKYVQVTFTQTNDPDGPQTLAVLFANGAHGDDYPFTSATTLAHTFYPYPLNPESIAGHQHFNDAETWRIGADVDVFSVALHETGHALGLGHSDNPADVMYPYYKKVAGLSPDDIAAGQLLYAPVTSPAPAPPVSTTTSSPSPLAITIQPPAATTTATSTALNGTASGGSGAIAVSWSTDQGASGTAQVSPPENSSSSSSSWSVASIPLIAGANVITVTAQDAIGDTVSASVTVTSQPPLTDTPISGSPNPSPSNPSPSAPSPPANPSPGGNSAPPSLTILSPAATFVSTSTGSIIVSGIAQDSLGITQITWTSSTGGAGVASGTSNWSTGPISLYEGMTTIMIYATDTAGNQSWRSIMVEQQ